MHPGYVLAILLVYLFLGVGLNNVLKETKQGGFFPAVMIWPFFLIVAAVLGKDMFNA
jgi:hypothetical protein